MLIQRYLQAQILNDLKKKMVFLGGPRQCGKTTLAKQVLEMRRGAYFDWDNDEDRRHILSKDWGESDELVVFDELHKFKRWKNWIKGSYDSERDRRRFLVTGSARLDVYRRGGDSLMGRYHYWRLHPFTLSELPGGMAPSEALRRLMSVGGFPEPFLDGDEREARRWRKERFDKIFRDDIRDLESLRDISTLSLFADALRRRVGSLIVLDNIAGELQVSHKTLKHWLEILEKMYVIFIVRPYTKNLPRAIQKPPKVYFFDNADVVGDEGARFENLVATSLIKRCHFHEDRDGYRFELRYIRDKEKREVDFAIVRDDVVEELVEAKYGDADFSPNLAYYAERFKPQRAVQVVATLKKPASRGRLMMESPLEYLAQI